MKSPPIKDSERMRRTTFSLPQEFYEDLEKIAESKRVAVSWVIRDAIEKYISEMHPLFSQRNP